MNMTIANPIYDAVFKYLMEDERIARTILSALLKKNIVKVEVRPHEYANDKRDTISVFRIDFGATVREDDGTERLILVELQKTWLETETLRFRQYLGVQYQDKRNIKEDSKDGNALPMVAVYLLGHKVGEIEEPVLYVNHRSYDYDGKEVKKGLPNPFVDSLTHDSIIVQIPRLHGQINNRLDKVLSIFDQTRMVNGNQQMLAIDDRTYAGDDEMQHILRRLLAAASDADMRMDMNVEDEYFSVIEKRDTEILLKAKQIAQQKVFIKEQENLIRQNKAELEQNKAELEQNKAELEQNKAELEQNKAELEQNKAELEQNKAELEQNKAELEQKDLSLKKAVKAFRSAGMSIEAIAATLNMQPEEIEKMATE